MTRVADPALAGLRDKVLRMGGLAEAILAKSVEALGRRDAPLAAEVQADDIEIDRIDLAIDAAVLRVLATQAPVADDLREVVASKMIANDLERVGDLARNIAKSALRFSERPAFSMPAKLAELADDSRRLLREALNSFAERDPALARRVLLEDDRVDDDQDAVILEALQEMSRNPEAGPGSVDVILVAKNLERVGDHATNIAESVVMISEAENLKHAAKLGGGAR